MPLEFEARFQCKFLTAPPGKALKKMFPNLVLRSGNRHCLKWLWGVLEWSDFVLKEGGVKELEGNLIEK